MATVEASRKQSRSVSFWIVAILVTLLFCSGFVNLLPLPSGGRYPATLLIDGTYFLMGAGLVVVVAQSRGRVPFPLWVGLFLVLIGVYCALMFHSPEPLMAQVLGIRSRAGYALVSVFILIAVRQRSELISLLRLSSGMAVGIAIFGIIQFVFRGNLPQWLLVSRDTTLFGYYGTDLTRATGLIGNTIVFAATMLLFFALGVGRLVYRFRSRDLLPLGLILTAIIVSFSRAAMAGAMLIILCALSFMALRSRPEKALLATLTLLFPCIGLGLIFAVWPRALSGVTDSFIYEGLFRGRNASVSDSTEAHLAFIELAQRTMRQEPWVGLGVATQDPGSVHGRTSTVITDGAIWAVFTEGGIILGVAYATFILSCGGALVVAWRSANYARPLILGFALFVTFQLGLASIYNSAIFGKAPFILSWVVFGVIMGLARGEAVDYGGTIENAKLNRNCSGAS